MGVFYFLFQTSVVVSIIIIIFSFVFMFIFMASAVNGITSAHSLILRGVHSYNCSVQPVFTFILVQLGRTGDLTMISLAHARIRLFSSVRFAFLLSFFYWFASIVIFIENEPRGRRYNGMSVGFWCVLDQNCFGFWWRLTLYRDASSWRFVLELH